MTQTIDGSGQAITYTHDAQGHVTREQFADGSFVTYTYDSHGNLTSATNSSGTTTLAYGDPTYPSLLTKITYPSGQFLAYAYDAAGRETQMVDQDGFTENYSYDALGSLAQITGSGGALIARYTYDADGRVAEEDDGNGTSTTYAYDADGNLLDVINDAPDHSVSSMFDYTYDTLGRRTSMTTQGGTTTYQYDADNELTSVTDSSGKVTTYQYDSDGNRISQTTDGATTPYSANLMDQYTSVGSATYSYDKDGNLVETAGASGNTTYTYDVQGRLINVTTPTDTWTYQYDALGNRISEAHNGVKTNNLVDPSGNVIAQYDSSGHLIADYTQGLGLELTSRVDSSGNADYYAFDAQGNTAALTGPTGAVLDSYSYSPFGEVLSSSGSVPNPYTFGGQFGATQQGDGLISMGPRSTARRWDGSFRSIRSGSTVTPTSTHTRAMIRSITPTPTAWGGRRLKSSAAPFGLSPRPRVSTPTSKPRARASCRLTHCRRLTRSPRRRSPSPPRRQIQPRRYQRSPSHRH